MKNSVILAAIILIAFVFGTTMQAAPSDTPEDPSILLETEEGE